MSTLGQDIGTAAVLLLCALTLIIRARYFCTYGKEALYVTVFYILVGTVLRIASTHELITPLAARSISGYFGIVCLVLQVGNVWLGELTYRKDRTT